MNELQRILARVEELMNSGQIQGAKNLLYIAQGHAQSATNLISDQVKSMTEQQLRINGLAERLKFNEDRARCYHKRLIELGDMPEDESCAKE